MRMSSFDKTRRKRWKVWESDAGLEAGTSTWPHNPSGSVRRHLPMIQGTEGLETAFSKLTAGGFNLHLCRWSMLWKNEVKRWRAWTYPLPAWPCPRGCSRCRRRSLPPPPGAWRCSSAPHPPPQTDRPPGPPLPPLPPAPGASGRRWQEEKDTSPELEFKLQQTQISRCKKIER